MTTFPLDKFFTGHVFAFLLVLCRIGGVMMLFPGLSETYVSARFRMMLALTISFLLVGPLLPRIPAPPEAMADLGLLIAKEMVIGLFFGSILRLIMSALENAGAMIALQTGLSNATVLNPALASQSPLAAAFLSVAGVTMVFVTGLDHFMLRSMVALYDMFPPGGEIMAGDMAQVMIKTINSSFVVGIELGSPFLVIGLLMYLALGIMQKLLPQIQLFLVALPVQIYGGLALVSITIAGIMTMWLRYADATIGAFFGR